MTKAEREALEALAADIEKEAALRIKIQGPNQHDLKVASWAERLRATLDKPATRYPWDQAPEWAKFAAEDEDGERWWFSAEPEALDCGVWNPSKYPCELFRDAVEYDWRDSLERRPDAP